MLLVINANNTNLKVALCQDRAIVAQWRARTDPHRTADEYAAWLLPLMTLRRVEPTAVNAAIIATVVPAALRDLSLLCQQYFHCEPLVVGDDHVDTGIMLKVDRPHEVGADRIANAVGGFMTFGGPLIIADLGTATTFDVIDRDGHYCGGIIAPGVNTSLEALHRATAKLPRITVAKPDRVVGLDTLGAMRAGAYWGYVGLMEGLITRIQQEREQKMTVVATGGLAPLFQEASSLIDAFDPDITLRGLIEIHRRATSGSTR